mmetsp:Transcript_30253/g.69341  ORF Transcript_30253/g.69341 Transcript_30253/m.69341 type:complete len:531 (-) Transcript_30253:1478-3070(-)
MTTKMSTASLSSDGSTGPLAPSSNRSNQGGIPLALPGFLRRPRRSNNGNTSAASASTFNVSGNGTPVLSSASTPISISENLSPSNVSPISQAVAVLRVTNSSKNAIGSPAPKPTRAEPDRRDQRRRAAAAALAQLNETKLGSRGNSNANLFLSSPPLSSLPKYLSYRHRQLASTMSAPVVALSALRSQCWNGIATTLRAEAWKVLLGVTPANASRRDVVLSRRRREYASAVGTYWTDDEGGVDGGGNVGHFRRTPQEQETLRQILVDVPRTSPDVDLFREPRVATAMGRMLYIWAVKHPASSYVQGINDLATPLYVVFLDDVRRKYGYGRDGGCDDDGGGGIDIDGLTTRGMPDSLLEQVEADAYHSLTSLLAGIQDHYTNDQPGIQRMVFKLKELVARIDPPLYQHLEERGVDFIQFSFRWMNCLLLREVPLRIAVRMWDTYLAEGGGSSAGSSDGSTAQLMAASIDSSSGGNTAYGFETFHVYVCAAFLCKFGAVIRTMEFEEMFGFLQKLPTSSWGNEDIEMIMSQA